MYEAGCQCYDNTQLKKIAAGVIQLQLCQIDLTAKDKLIQERLVATESATSELPWWMEPRVMIGGMVVSATIGAGLVYLVRK